MKKRLLMGLMSAVMIGALVFTAPPSQAEEKTEKKAETLTISGAVSKEASIDVASLEKLGGEEVEWKHKDKTYRFTGVPLEKVLAEHGVKAGVMSNEIPKPEKLAGLKYVIVGSSPDGYQAVFSFSELSTFQGQPTKAFVVWKLDGKPLPEEMGPFRLVVPTDKEGARSMYHLAALQVVDMRQVVKPMEPVK